MYRSTYRSFYLADARRISLTMIIQCARGSFDVSIGLDWMRYPAPAGGLVWHLPPPALNDSWNERNPAFYRTPVLTVLYWPPMSSTVLSTTLLPLPWSRVNI